MASTLRHICALLLLLAFGLGLPLQGAQAGGMGAKMITGASMPMPDDCDDCSDDDGMNATTCTAVCLGGVPAVLPVKVLIVAERVAGPDMSSPSVSRGSSRPPDPHPPKTPIVS